MEPQEAIKKILYGVGGIVLLLIIVFTVRYLLKRGETKLPQETFTINFWQPIDRSEDLKPFIEEYQRKHSNITINYVKKNEKDYEEELLNALAEGRGPDIFSLKSDWLPKHLAKLAPLEENIMTKKTYEETFVKPVREALIFEGRVYGFALSSDSLGLFYNPDLLSEARIYQPPSTWNEVLKVAKKVTLRRKGKIIRSGAALGTAKNTNYAFDILSALMLQKGTPMISEDKKKAYFNLASQSEEGKVYFPGTESLVFYTSFSNPKKSNYSWNTKMGKSIEAFIAGKAALYFGYASDISYLKKRAPKLAFETAPLPQMRVGDEIYYASFWTESVSKDSRYKEAAFDFLKFLTSKENLRNYYQSLYGKKIYTLTSRQDLVESQEQKPYLEDFVKTLEGTRNWYKADGRRFEEIFLAMISNVVGGKLSPQQAIDSASKEITTILEKEE